MLFLVYLPSSVFVNVHSYIKTLLNHFESLLLVFNLGERGHELYLNFFIALKISMDPIVCPTCF